MEEKALALSTQRGNVPVVSIRSLDDVSHVADIILAAGWGGQSRKREEVMAKVLKGAELGLGAFEAQNSIALISGKPCVYGDAMLAVCMASGLLEDIHEELDKAQDGEITATCTVKRKTLKSSTVRKFSTRDAKMAGLLDKQGPWRQNPKRMIQMRARAFALRDAFPDVLCGVHAAEEMDGAEMMSGEGAISVESAPLPPPVPRRAQRKAATPKDPEPPVTVPFEPPAGEPIEAEYEPVVDPATGEIAEDDGAPEPQPEPEDDDEGMVI